MSKELSVSEVIDLTEKRFKQVAPKAISYEAEKGFAMQLLTNNGYLMKVAKENPTSLAQAITNVAAIGLSLNPAEKLAYLIPRNMKERQGNKDVWVSKIFLEPSYMGLCKLATDAGSIEWVQARCAYESDTVADNGVGEKPSHTYSPFSTDRGDFVGVYCVAKTHTGDYLTTFMTVEKVNNIMERSEAVKSYRNNKGSGGPWISDYEEQAKKTVVRQASKLWPKTNQRMMQAVHLSNENEGFEPIMTSPKTMDFTAGQKSYYDRLIENNDALEMYVLLTTVEESVRNNLYHSFEKGTKGKYQQIVDTLYLNGKAVFDDCITAMNETEDESAVLEVAEELSNDAIELMGNKLSDNSRAIIDENRESV